MHCGGTISGLDSPETTKKSETTPPDPTLLPLASNFDFWIGFIRCVYLIERFSPLGVESYCALHNAGTDCPCRAEVYLDRRGSLTCLLSSPLIVQPKLNPRRHLPHLHLLFQHRSTQPIDISENVQQKEGFRYRISRYVRSDL